MGRNMERISTQGAAWSPIRPFGQRFSEINEMDCELTQL